MKMLVAVAATLLAVQAGTWHGSATAGLALSERAGTLAIANTGNGSVDLWQEGSPALSGAYTVRATLRKASGRNHEGYGILFGGRGLGTDSARYSYVLIRGDGAVLVKKRTGAATPVVRDWQVADAVHKDDASSHAENVLELRIAAAQVIVLVNGAEVARVPAADLYTNGVAGLRVSHQMQVEMSGWTAGR